jgi:hypothetical protein
MGSGSSAEAKKGTAAAVASAHDEGGGARKVLVKGKVADSVKDEDHILPISAAAENPVVERVRTRMCDDGIEREEDVPKKVHIDYSHPKLQREPTKVDARGKNRERWNSLVGKVERAKNIPVESPVLWLCIQLAKLVYKMDGEDEEQRELILGALSELEMNETRFIYDDETSTEGFICSNDNIIVVVFKGSQEIKDWVNDLKDQLVAIDGKVKVHMGFNECTQSIVDDVRENLDDMLAQNPRPVCT